MIPEKSTQIGVGETACASASQQWKGKIAALVRKPQVISEKAKRTRAS
jgi:hypothetical protein